MGTKSYGVHGVKHSAQNSDGEITCFVDSDWAGCRETRKSTSGGALFIGGTLVGAWSKTQSIVAQSSAEAEFYSIHRGLVESLFVQSLAAEMGMALPIFVYSDSSAGRAMAQRRGVGKVKHIQIKNLFAQDVICGGQAAVRKVLGTLNCADLMTKHVDYETLRRMRDLMQIRAIALPGRAVSAVIMMSGEVHNKKQRSTQLRELTLQSAVLASCLIPVHSGRAPLDEDDVPAKDFSGFLGWTFLAVLVILLGYEVLRRLCVFLARHFRETVILQQRLDEAQEQLAQARRQLGTGPPAASASTTTTTTRVRTMLCQSQVTYRRDLSTPRFQPLVPRETGAWED